VTSFLALRDAPGSFRDAVLRLNALYEAETSPLDDARLVAMAKAACFAEAVPDGDGVAAVLIAFDETAAYDSPNFLWFRARFPRFLYIDRVVVAPEARGRGLARALYEELFRRALAAGHDTAVCEVNLVPPNPASDAFHARLGFEEVGRATVGAKTVRYLSRPLAERPYRLPR
jgi:predicted GNAT superfamily acetyltransferase